MAKWKTAADASLKAGIVLIIAGLIFFFVCMGLVADTKRFAETAQETQALITRVEKERVRRNGKYRTDYDVYVLYAVDGVTYNEELNGGSSGMYEGSTITVYYDPANPRDVRKSTGTGAQTFGVVFSLVFVAVGAFTGIRPALKSAERKKLKETGVQASGLITSVTPDTSIRINKRHPYKAECEVTDPITGERYLYASEGVMNDIRYMQGQSVTVYYDPADRSKYYVDLDSAEDNVMGGGPQVYDFR